VLEIPCVDAGFVELETAFAPTILLERSKARFHGIATDRRRRALLLTVPADDEMEDAQHVPRRSRGGTKQLRFEGPIVLEHVLDSVPASVAVGVNPPAEE
jgi:hypothetical protein